MQELDTYVGQLSVILDSVATVSAVAGAAGDIEPTTHAVPLTNVYRDDVVRPGLIARGGAGRRARGARTAASACRRSWEKSSDAANSPRMTAAAAGRRRSPAARSAPSRSRRRTWTGSRPSTAPCTRSCTSPPSPRWRRPRAVDEARANGASRGVAAGRSAAGAQGHRRAARRPGHRRHRRSSRAGSRPMTRPSPAGCWTPAS